MCASLQVVLVVSPIADLTEIHRYPPPSHPSTREPVWLPSFAVLDYIHQIIGRDESRSIHGGHVGCWHRQRKSLERQVIRCKPFFSSAFRTFPPNTVGRGGPISASVVKSMIHSLISESEYFGELCAVLSLHNRFVQLVRKHRPHSLLHFEDFGTANASRLLKKYRDQHAVFNDDM